MIKKKAIYIHRQTKLFIALILLCSLGAGAAAVAQTTAPEPVVVPGNGTATDLNAYQIQQVKILYKKLLLKEKDIPNATSELTQKDIKAANPTMGSIQTVLTQTPSVVAYAQGPGQSAPTLAIRGVKNDELAETLDGVPLSDLLNGSGDYLSNNVGSPVTLNEIDTINVYPGVAPPDHQGFGTVGGTIAYTTKQPTDDPYAQLEGGFGSFDTQHIGFVINTGKIGDGDDAPKMLMLYDQSQTAGYIDYTNAQYHDFMFNLQKPYDNGLSKVGLVIIFNQGKGNLQTTPTPTALINKYGYTYNFPKNLGYYYQTGQDLTTILSDETYINPHLIFDGSLFYLHQESTTNSYANPITTAGDYPYTVNVQAPYDFFGCVGPGSIFYAPGYFTLNGGSTPIECATNESSLYSLQHNNTIGITPKLTIFLPYNTITIGALIAKESGDSGSAVNQQYMGDQNVQNEQQVGYNAFIYGGGEQRSAYVGYIQDKIDLFNDHLHLLPGARVTAAYTSNIELVVDGIYQPGKYQNYSKVGEPYLGISYDLPDHFVAYGSYGKGSLFAPANYYSQGLTGLPGTTNAPSPEILHVFEGGLRYDTPRLYLNVDYYYQKIDDAFSFYEDYLTDQQYYANTEANLYRGVEMSGEFRVTPTVSIFANGSHINTDYLKTNYAFVTLQQDQYGYGFKGTPLSNVPDWTANMGIDYDDGPFSARLSGQYTGREYETYDLYTPCTPAQPNACTGPLSGATVTDVNMLNPANYEVNLLLSYNVPIPPAAHIKTLNVTLTALNLLDEHYYVYKYSSETAAAGVYSVNPEYESGFVGPPRSIMVDLAATF